MHLWYALDEQLLRNRKFLLLLLAVNVLGTAYGYVWYWEQLVDTVREQSFWLVLFVPDSPTASLWFTISLGLLLFAPAAARSPLGAFIAVLGAISSVKYGVWAVAMNASVAYQGEALVWEEYMLIASHLGMAVEALLYIRFFPVRPVYVMLSAALLLFNDWLDYNVGIFPWLRNVLLDDLAAIEWFTWIMTAVSVAVVVLVFRWSKTGQTPIK